MKDESPRIFRNLEKTAGRDGFDTIVGAAVASYGSLRSPNDTQARDFGRLVDPLWDKISPETRRTTAAALSKSVRVPRSIVTRLLAEPLEISAPFLTSSPALDASDLLLLGTSPDTRLRKILDNRAAPAAASKSVSAITSSTATASSKVDPAPAEPDARASSNVDAIASPSPAIPSAASEIAASAETPAADEPTRDTEPASPSPAPAPIPATPPIPQLRARSTPRPAPAETGTRADLVRETLRRLALTGRQSGPIAEPIPKLQDLVALAVQQDSQRFHEGLRLKLNLSDTVLEKIASDESGERLAVALKAMNAGAADALTILMMLKPRIGLDVEAFGQMTKYYRALKPEDCAALTGAKLRRPTVAAPTLEPQYQDLEPLDRQAPRPTFGRRNSRPGESDKGTKRA